MNQCVRPTNQSDPGQRVGPAAADETA